MVEQQCKTHGFHSDLAGERRCCINPGFVCIFHVAGQISTAHELNSTPFGPAPAGVGLSSPGIASDRDVPAVEMRGKEVGVGGVKGREMCRLEQLQAEHT